MKERSICWSNLTQIMLSWAKRLILYFRSPRLSVYQVTRPAVWCMQVILFSYGKVSCPPKQSFSKPLSKIPKCMLPSYVTARTASQCVHRGSSAWWWWWQFVERWQRDLQWPCPAFPPRSGHWPPQSSGQWAAHFCSSKAQTEKEASSWRPNTNLTDSNREVNT